MSLYESIDYIDSNLTQSKTRKLDLSDNKFDQNNCDNSLSHVDKEFIKILRHKLVNRTRKDDYSNLWGEIQLIENYLNLNSHIPKSNGLYFILDDLYCIQKKQNRLYKQSRHQPSQEYQKFQVEEYKIADLKQGRSFRLGNSRGVCYGFTLSMVDPETSPYKNSGVKVRLNEKIHNYQKNVSDRIQDQVIIKRSRMTREHFTPDAKKQAEKIYAYANKNKGKELLLTRRASVGAHACYVNKQENGALWYTDPNHGVYSFKNKEDFVAFYCAAAQEEKRKGIDFRFYQIDELKYDPDNKLPESKTIMGKVRSLLTGGKYNDGHRTSAEITRSVYAAAGIGMGAVIGGVFGGAIGSVIPIIGTTIGVFMGAATGVIVGGTTGYFNANSLTAKAAAHGHRGLLGVPHLIQDTLYDFKQRIKNIFSVENNNTTQSEVRPNKEKETEYSDSSTRILSQFNQNPSCKNTANSIALSAGSNSNGEKNEYTRAYQKNKSVSNDTLNTEGISEEEAYGEEKKDKIKSTDCDDEPYNHSHFITL